jgi:transcriptional regulator with XRE-family HTH domain
VTPRDVSLDAEFADRLKRLRVAKGWTQGELSAASGVAKRSIEDYERGRVPGRAMPKLAAALDVSTHYLALGIEPVDTRLAELQRRMDRLEVRMLQLEEVLASAAEAQQRIWLSIDATLKLVLAQFASREVLDELGDPPAGGG